LQTDHAAVKVLKAGTPFLVVNTDFTCRWCEVDFVNQLTF